MLGRFELVRRVMVCERVNLVNMTLFPNRQSERMRIETVQMVFPYPELLHR